MEFLGVACECHVDVCSSKGLLSGAIAFLTKEQRLIDCRHQQVLISETLLKCRVLNGAEFIVVVEKDAAFQKMIDDGFFECFPGSILVTGRGYPDLCTRKMMRWLVDQLSVPLYGLFDSDPHGQDCYVKQIQWLGFKPSEVHNLPVASNQYIKLSNRDFVKIRKLRRRAQALGEQNVVVELDILCSLRSKLELEALSSIAPQFIVRMYLLPRLKDVLESHRTIKLSTEPEEET
ncbi:unnamed protein product [Cylicocyclus nassatus]|uniref:Topoisomerase 6 subunit A/Spo11 TOPRIM domain-containing protein n=1 Tax=Cylicocyclus nassatus TaxID=53992 RepID=A0AA36H451_CYLNA|nr:unnamed protein product [Cylicocyclus nassatus]